MSADKVTDAVLDRAWNELSGSPGRPKALTAKRMQELKKRVASDREFWSDLLDRHGLRGKRLADLDEPVRLHAIGNFWGMLAQEAYEAGWKI